MATQFLTEEGNTYIKEAAEYLEERCLTIQDIPIKPFAYKNHGLSTKDGVGYPLQGWAIVVKGPDGLPNPERLHLRVCNWPDHALYYIRGKLAEVYKDRPKFVQMFKEEFLHFTRPKNEICHANVVMLHEKITSAELATKFLDIPGLAISGCAGWSKDSKMGPELEHTIKNMALGTKLLVCFDGDIGYKPGIQESAKGLKGWIALIRPDIKVVFLAVPENEGGVGWDDWAVCQGAQLAANWAREIIEQETGVEISDFVPPGFLVEEYQLEVREDNNGNTRAVHTLDNYRRLTKFPKWARMASDISGAIYDSEDVDAGAISLDNLVMEFRCWLETSAYRGTGDSVRSTYARDAMGIMLSTNQISVPLELLSRQDEVTEEQALAAATKLVTEGIKVLGPMNQEQAALTWIRMARDMVALWSLDNTVDIQWACALVGPSGCGKSNFPSSFLGCFADWGYQPRIAKLSKEGNMATLPELFKACRDSMVGVFDEYNPDERCARQVEQNLFTLSTTRSTNVRALYKESAEQCTRHSTLFLTTVDTNKEYIRSSKGDGERRFITFMVKGVKPHYGLMSSDRVVIRECGAILLRYGYQLFMAGDSARTTEFSNETTGDFIGKATVLGKMGVFWARGDLMGVMNNFGDKYHHKKRVYFTMNMMIDLLMPGERLTRQDRADLKSFFIELGAENSGQGRVNGTMKDERWVVDDWKTFAESVIAKI